MFVLVQSGGVFRPKERWRQLCWRWHLRDVGKGALRGPGNIGFDAGMSTNFTLYEKYKLRFRGEFFNAMNHVNPNNPNTAINSAQFGKIKGVGSPRAGQLALKLTS